MFYRSQVLTLEQAIIGQQREVPEYLREACLRVLEIASRYQPDRSELNSLLVALQSRGLLAPYRISDCEAIVDTIRHTVELSLLLYRHNQKAAAHEVIHVVSGLCWQAAEMIVNGLKDLPPQAEDQGLLTLILQVRHLDAIGLTLHSIYHSEGIQPPVYLDQPTFLRKKFSDFNQPTARAAGAPAAGQETPRSTQRQGAPQQPKLALTDHDPTSSKTAALTIVSHPAPTSEDTHLEELSFEARSLIATKLKGHQMLLRTGGRTPMQTGLRSPGLFIH